MNDAHSERNYAEGEPEDGRAPYGRQPYDPYRQQAPYYDPYAQQQAPPQQSQPSYRDPHGRQYHDPHAQQQVPPQAGGQQWGPQQPTYDPYAQSQWPPQSQAPPQQAPQPHGPPQAQQRPPEPAPDYSTEQFSFIEDPDEGSEDVIDWLRFAETRSERRDERKRKSRNRLISLVVVLGIALAGGAGYLWYAGKLPGVADLGAGPQAAGGQQKRDVIVVHLRDTRKGGGSSTALLVENQTTKKGTTVLLPNSLAVPTDDGGSTTLGKSVEDAGTTSTRDSLNAVLGSDIKGSWRLDTPYLENLVEAVGGIVVDTDVTVPGAKKGDDPLVKRGKDQELSGQAAVAYATRLAPGEQQTQQLLRFGRVMQAMLKKISSDPGVATDTVRALNQIPDPSLTEDQLGASLARLAEQAKTGSYKTVPLPVRADGTLSENVSRSVVKDVLGGTVKNADPDAAPRVSVRNATGDPKATAGARVTLVNSGYSFVDAGSASIVQVASQVTYADAAQAAKAKEVAKTLGLPASAVRKARGAANADVTVVLGKDYRTG